MRKIFPIVLVLLAAAEAGNAQYPGGGGRYRRYMQERQQDQQSFTPSVEINIGYGFPNLDKYLLDDFANYYSRTGMQTGPITGTVQYRFNPRMAIGVMVNYGKVSKSYYSYNTTEKIFTGNLTNTAVLLNFTRYLPGSRKVEPYIRTAIGVNTGKAEYLDDSGEKFVNPNDATSLAYQAGIGANFYLHKNVGLFAEAGYGKYILSGGLTLKF